MMTIRHSRSKTVATAAVFVVLVAMWIGWLSNREAIGMVMDLLA